MATDRWRILLIDSDADSVSAFKKLLLGFRQAEYDVEVVENYHDALSALKQQQHHITFLDFAFGNGNGFELMKDAGVGSEDPPVILITQREDEEIENLALKEGVADYLLKSSLNPRLLERSIRYALERQRNFKLQQQQSRELRKTREEALLSNRTKAEFLANMGHELRTPLNSILGMADLLDDTELDEQQTKYVDTFRRSGKNLLQIINDILDFSKIETGSLEPQPTAFQFRPLLQKVTDNMARRAREKGLDFECEIEDTLPDWLHGDPDKLIQILICILGNATKFTDQGLIKLRCFILRQNDDHIHLQFEITDTGIGISKNDLPHIFSDFTQVDSSLQRRFGGTGLGLTISKRLVDKLEGTIEVTSRKGKGSCFVFTIPFKTIKQIREDETRLDEPPTQYQIEANVTDKPRILMVEDSVDNRLLMRAFFQGADFEIDEAHHGAMALEMIQKNDYDIILMDMQMPVMDGFEASKAIRKWERDHGRPEVPIVAITAFTIEDERIRLQEAGCTAHLSKPLQRKSLLQMVDKMSTRIQDAKDFTVTVPEDLRELIPGYIQNRRSDIEHIQIHLKEKDFDSIRVLGHKMHGSGAGYGFHGITTIGQHIENAAKSKNQKTIQLQSKRLLEYLNKLNILYE